MINQLAVALRHELGLTSKEIADIVWLTLQMNEPESATSRVDEGNITTTNQQNLRHSQKRKPINQNQLEFLSDSEENIKSQKIKSSKAELHSPSSTQTTTQDGMGAGLPLKVADARSLREPLPLADSLKPLLKRVMVGLSTVLDEAATVRYIADQNIWMPVLKPSLEPWLDLALVVDENISMHLWQKTIKELQKILKNYGVFRDVRVWSLIKEEGKQVKLYPKKESIAQRASSSLREPSELIDPSGRRLILVATDCVSTIWRDGSMLPLLNMWTTSGPMAIVQMLPEWLWERTALGWASVVKLHSPRPGISNQQLEVRNLSSWEEVNLEIGTPVPVVTLAPETFLNWAKMLTSKGGIWSTGFVFDSDSLHRGTESNQLQALNGKTIEQQVQQFRSISSPMARRLAGLLAAAPVISLPIVRIIRD
ncbi:SAV_2336 N-terminal domain-related protein [Leptothoe sp. EHU-05/26/07-4]